MEHRPIFIHGFWRTASTYIWKKFRDQPAYRAYYEPLHELLVKPRAEVLAACAESQTGDLRHPGMDDFYFAEFLFSEAGVEFFEKPLSYERYCIDDDEPDSALRRYIGNLISQASRHSQIPVLQFNRSLFRIGWLTRNFAPLNVLLLRKPANVWKSMLAFKGHSFTSIFTIVLGQNRRKEPLKHLPEWVELPSYAAATIEGDYSYYGPLAIEYERLLYPSFFDFYLLSTIRALPYADCVLDMDEISSNPAVRAATAARLRELDITLNLDDCAIPSHTLSREEESDWGAYELFARHFLARTLPGDVRVEREHLTKHTALLSPYFRDLLSDFIDRRQTSLYESAPVRASRAAILHAGGIQVFQEDNIREACDAFAQSLAIESDSERWNDWATAHAACSHWLMAELGYRKALREDANNCEAAINLAALIGTRGRSAEAISMLSHLARGASAGKRPLIESLIIRLAGSQPQYTHSASELPAIR
jgi:hypothetical protein